MSRFARYELRARDPEAAQKFYTDVLGPDFWGPEVTRGYLPERAAQMGAPPHWLGHLEVADVDATAARIAENGGQRLGPTQQGIGGALSAILRDLGGAVFAISDEPIAASGPRVAWHLLNAEDEARAFKWYASFFDWTANEHLELGSGRQQLFAWDNSRHSIGSITNSVRLPIVHPHWLFFFKVPSLDEAIDRVRTLGGTALPTFAMPSGDRVAACDDAQGSAFGLLQSAS